MSDTIPEVDVLDPEYRSFEKAMARRERFFIAMRHLDDLSRQLTRQADDEYEQRQGAEPLEQRERRQERERTLRDLIERADVASDPGEAARLLSAVDAVLSGQ